MAAPLWHAGNQYRAYARNDMSAPSSAEGRETRDIAEAIKTGIGRISSVMRATISEKRKQNHRVPASTEGRAAS